MNAAELIEFEADIAAQFNAGRIHAPIHLSGGNENELIEIFKEIRPTDWVFSTWRNHWHALLHGVPAAQVRADILAGKSITLTYPEHRFFSSAIVGGHLPIAVGTALSIKLDGGADRVWVFMGDMASRSGVAHECIQYAFGHSLPISFVVEDNDISVFTPTDETWGGPVNRNATLRRYSYQLTWPHSGAGKWIRW